MNSRSALTLLLFLLFLATAACSGPQQQQQPFDGGLADGGLADGGLAELSIMSWNIENFPMTDNSIDSVAAIIRDLNVDLIGVQEIADPAKFDTLADRLAGYSAVYADDPGAYIRVGLLYKTASVQITNVETLFPGDWYAFPRPPLKVEVSAKGLDGGIAFDFVLLVLHLKASLDTESQNRRRDACQKLEAWMSARMAAGGEQDYILLGDWNDLITDAPAYNIYKAFLDKHESYIFLTGPLADAGAYTFLPYQNMLDHIMITSDALWEYGMGKTEILPLESRYPDYLLNVSDHRPVLSRFIFP